MKKIACYYCQKLQCQIGEIKIESVFGFTPKITQDADNCKMFY